MMAIMAFLLSNLLSYHEVLAHTELNWESTSVDLVNMERCAT